MNDSGLMKPSICSRGLNAGQHHESDKEMHTAMSGDVHPKSRGRQNEPIRNAERKRLTERSYARRRRHSQPAAALGPERFRFRFVRWADIASAKSPEASSERLTIMTEHSEAIPTGAGRGGSRHRAEVQSLHRALVAQDHRGVERLGVQARQGRLQIRRLGDMGPSTTPMDLRASSCSSPPMGGSSG